MSVVAEGAFNLRDVADAAPGVVRPGVLFRAGNLGRLTASGRQRLAELGIVTVLDLRHEPTDEPDARIPGARRVNVPMGSAVLPPERREPDPFEEPGRTPEEYLAAYAADKTRHYVAEVLYTPAAFGRALTELGRPGALPALVHCASGKDRTGLTCAMVLRLAGASEDEAVADYLASRGGLPPHRFDRHRPALERLGIEPERFRPVYEAHEAALRAALSVAEVGWGTIERYLVVAGQADEASLERLRAALALG